MIRFRHSSSCRVLPLAGTLVFLATSALVTGCQGQTSRTVASSDEEILATVDGQPVRISDLRERIGPQLDQLEIQYRQRRAELLQEALEQHLEDRLLREEATARGMSIGELLEAEAGAPGEVTEAEVAEWYEQNRARLRGGTLQQLYPQIVGYLELTRAEGIRAEYVQRLREEREVVTYVEPYRVALDNEGAPALGPEDALVTLTEFSDFECPYCRTFVPTLWRLAETYGDRLRIVYRQFPLTNIHPNAVRAAEASLCAHDQGRFWEMHDALFQDRRLGADDIKEKASQAGLDGEEFDACLALGRHAERVQSDLREGSVAGVSGTPALFVNGIRVPGGAAPYETVAKLIDDELRRAER